MNAPNECLPVAQQDGSGTAMSLVMDSQAMEKMITAAELMASAKVTIPAHLRGSRGDCLAVIMQAAQWKMNPFAVAQKTHVVNGTLGYEAQLVNAVLQATGVVSSRPHYEYRGDGPTLECRVGFVITGDAEITWNEWLCFGTVTTKNSPLWKTNPKQQMGYLQVKNWARAYTPGAILGVYDVDELEASPPMEKEINPMPKDTERRATQLPPWPDENFQAKLKQWRANGTKNEDEFIAMLSTKGTLSDAQIAEIRKGRGNTIDATAHDCESQTIEHPGVTFASVESSMRKATAQDTLDVAYDLASEIKDQQQRAELAALYDELSAKFSA